MADTEQTEQEVRTTETEAAPAQAAEAPATESPVVEAVATEAPAAANPAPTPRPERKGGERREGRPDRSQSDRPQGDRPQGERPQRGPGGAPQGQRREGGGNREGHGNREGRGPHGGREGGRDDRRGGDRGRFEGPLEIDIEKLISDPLYLDNQAHAVVSRMRDMDSGTKSQLRRLYNAVRRAVRTPENERQQQFVMLRARLAYTIARHSLRSLDSLEKLLLQVTRKNDARGYERFRDLFEAIVAYNE